MFGLFKTHSSNYSAPSARKQKAVRYIGASGYRRFSTAKRTAGHSVAAETWLVVVAAVLASLVALGVWQESQSAKNEKPAAPAKTAAAPVFPR